MDMHYRRFLGCPNAVVPALIVLALSILPAHAVILRVNAASTAPNPDGLMWETAFPELQPAADAAASGDELWVAAGTYAGSGATVVAIKDGITIYGGFAGGETAREQRNWTAHPAIIDGEHQRRCVHALGTGAIDGFTLQNGFSFDFAGGMWRGTAVNCIFSGNRVTDEYDYDGSAYNACGGGMYQGTAVGCAFIGNTAVSTHRRECALGGGMYGGTATDCAFTGNTSSYAGGAMYNGTATHCTFAGNRAESWCGGGMDCGKADRCIFSGNTAVGGGGMYNGRATNCVFTGNSAGYVNGGGMLDSVAVNCTFAVNSTMHGGGGMLHGTAVNCILWGNTPDETGETSVSHSCLSLATAGAGNIVANPLYVNPRAGDFRLRAGSTCVDTGTTEEAPTTDALGRMRPQGAGVDMGAYEYYPGDDAHAVIPPAVLWVNAASTAAAPDGLSWESAFPTLQAAADIAGYGTEIWVAQGTYTANEGEQVVLLNVGTFLYGGFTGSETAREARSSDTSSTVIDGQRARRCVTATGNAFVDGFVLQNGAAQYGGGMVFGAAAHCSFTGNVVEESGGGMYYGTATDCVFAGNSAKEGGNGGGGMCFGMATRCTFNGNSAAYAGGGMYYGTATDCTFTENSADYFGGGMSGGVATNCTFSRNSTPGQGGGMGGMWMSGGTAVNCVFSGNTAGSGGGMFGCKAINCTLFENEAGSEEGNGEGEMSTGGGMNNGEATNCILWGNIPGDIGGFDYAAFNCCMSSDAEVPGVGNIVGDPEFVDTLAGDYRLRAGSPCRDTGTLDNAPTTDRLGRARPQGSGVDMGAFEYYPGDDESVSAPPAVLRVNAASTATVPDGLTWEAAFPTLQAAADMAGNGTEIWVARGTYTANEGKQVVRLLGGVSMYGGFTGTETKRDARSTDASATTIDGQAGRRS